MINIYKASAGSGKTFTLAREYIKLLLGRKNEDGSYRLNRGVRNAHRSVLAITLHQQGHRGDENPYHP